MVDRSVMDNFSGIFRKLLLNVTSRDVVAVILIRVASVYRYVQVFV